VAGRSPSTKGRWWRRRSSCGSPRGRARSERWPSWSWRLFHVHISWFSLNWSLWAGTFFLSSWSFIFFQFLSRFWTS
jgi:hypothetical protein